MSLKNYYATPLSDEYLIEIAKFNLDGHGNIRKFFRNPVSDADELQDIWDYAATKPIYNYTSYSGENYYLCSSDDTDTQIIRVCLLDVNFLIAIVDVTLQGNTPIKIIKNGNDLYTRVYRMFNNSATDIAGVVYCVEGDAITDGVPDSAADVRAIISPGINQTLMSQFTIPSNCFGYLHSYAGSLTNKQTAAADIIASGREYGGGFRVQDYFGLNTAGNTYVARYFPVPIALPPGLDLKIQSNVSASDVGVAGSYCLSFVRSDLIGKANDLIIFQ